MLGSKSILPPTDATDCYIATQFLASYILFKKGWIKKWKTCQKSKSVSLQ